MPCVPATSHVWVREGMRKCVCLFPFPEALNSGSAPSLREVCASRAVLRVVELHLMAYLHAAEQYSPTGTLPDDVLVEIFDHHRLGTAPLRLKSGPWKWHRLAHVCRRWRFVIFSYSRCLDLRIISTHGTNSIHRSPIFWNPLPINIWYPRNRYGALSEMDEGNISVILENPARIREVDIMITRSLLIKCASSIKKSFPTLEFLRLRAPESDSGVPVILPSDFLGCSTPRLRDIRLDVTNFPALPRLLSSAKNLVSIQLERIHPERVFRADELATGLSAAAHLESLKIYFNPRVSSSIPRLPRLNDVSPSPTRTVLPALIELQYSGESTFLEDFAFMTDAPIIEKIGVSFFHRPQYETSELFGLFGRGEDLRSTHPRTTSIRFLLDVGVVFTHHFSRLPTSSGTFQVELPCHFLSDTYVPHLTQIFLGFASQDILDKVTQLDIKGTISFSSWRRETETWLDFFRALTGMKRLDVVGTPTSSVVSALGQVTGETSREILPALQELHMQVSPRIYPHPSMSESVTLVESFVRERRLHGLPISSVHCQGSNF